jgi:hypothetical protein
LLTGVPSKDFSDASFKAVFQELLKKKKEPPQQQVFTPSVDPAVLVEERLRKQEEQRK